MSQSLKKLTRSFLQETAKLETVWAVSNGVKGFQQTVSDLSPGAIRNYRQLLKQWTERLLKLPRPRIGSPDWLERELLMRALTLRLREWRPDGDYRQNPTYYVGEMVYGPWYLLLRGTSPGATVRACLGRLQGSVETLNFAKKHLKDPPKLWTQIAIQEAKGYQAFLKVLHREMIRLQPRLKPEIEKTCAEAEQTAKQLLRFLQRDLLPRSKGSIVAGERDFNFLLKTYHGYDLNAAALIRFGKKNFDDIRRQLAEQAKKIDRKATWPQIIKRLKKKYPGKANLLRTYRAEVRKLKSFLKRRSLVSFPADENLSVTETPSFTRDTIPYAAYVDPPMFSGKNQGVFFVTLPSGKNLAQTREVLAEHNYSSLKVTALHEGYPGHHLQFAKQKKAPGVMTRIFNCSSFYEGWALYCEEMMYEVGYYDEEVRLMQLRDKLWRACRVLIDAGLHTGTLSESQAVNFLSREAQMSKAGARVDVNWYTMRPTVPQGYLTGMLRIMELRSQYKKERGARFSLKKFHDDLLRYGAIPIPLVEKMVL